MAGATLTETPFRRQFLKLLGELFATPEMYL
jgi:hypothetical protein